MSLKLIDYNIAQPNPIYYLEFLYENIFISNKFKNIKYISKLNISTLKNIMCFSNNYMKYHPFYLSCFIIKFCFEQNKIDGFQKTLIDFFDINMRIFRHNYEDFLKSNNNQMKIAFLLEKQKKESKPLLHKKDEINSDIIKKIKNLERFKSISKSNFYNSTIYKSCSKEKKLSYNQNGNYLINIAINPMNNTYYKKFLDNFLSENSKEELSENLYHNQKTLEITEDNIENINSLYKHKVKINKMNYTIESPKKCGILMNYRYKKRIPEKANHVNNNKLVFFNLQKLYKSNNRPKNFKQKNNNSENENKNEENKENNSVNERENNNKKFNSELNSYSKRKHCYSIRKNYKNKIIRNVDKNNHCINNYSSNYVNNHEMNQKENGRNNKISSYLDKNKDYKSLHDNNIIIDDSNLISTINQNESSFSNDKNGKSYIPNKRIHKVHIRNFYKQKNSILLNFINSETKQILIK